VELTLRKYDIVDGLDTVGKRGVVGCDECVMGKIRRGPVDGKRRARNSKIVAKTRGVAFGVAVDGDTDYSELVVVKSRKAEKVTRWMEGRTGLWAQQGSVMKELRVDGGSELLGCATSVGQKAWHRGRDVCTGPASAQS
jgi:hypothetical protein